MKFRHHKYTWSNPYGTARYQWELRGPEGAIHFHVATYKDNEPTCGLEFHHATAPGDRAPDHLDCPLIGGPCWHDGTSLYATETLWPSIQHLHKAGNHEEVFKILENEYARHFSGADSPGFQARLAKAQEELAP